VARRRTGEQTQRGHNTGEQNEQGDKQRTTERHWNEIRRQEKENRKTETKTERTTQTNEKQNKNGEREPRKKKDQGERRNPEERREGREGCPERASRLRLQLPGKLPRFATIHLALCEGNLHSADHAWINHSFGTVRRSLITFALCIVCVSN
jgi:hypothetical protein